MRILGAGQKHGVGRRDQFNAVLTRGEFVWSDVELERDFYDTASGLFLGNAHNTKCGNKATKNGKASRRNISHLNSLGTADHR
jgi:hypothetical protein